MDITVDAVEKIKNDLDTFEVFAALMFNGIGRPGDFESFREELNRMIVELAVGPDTPFHLSKRLRYLFKGRIKNRTALRRHLPPDPRTAYRNFLSSVDQEGALGLERRELRALRNRHEHFLREFLARFPTKRD